MVYLCSTPLLFIKKNGLDDVNAVQQHSSAAWNGDFDAALLDQGSSAYKSWLTK